LLGPVVFTFARVSATPGVNVGVLFRPKMPVGAPPRGKVHDMPTHHTLEEYLSDYLERRPSCPIDRRPLFQSFKRRPYGGGAPELSGRRLSRVEVWRMVKRRAEVVGLDTYVCNHTWRETGITTYLENGGTLENAKVMAAHASVRTTRLPRRNDVTLDEVVKINIRG
jgi:integrase